MTVDFSAFDRCAALVVGDLMLDEYLWGDADRISPEAPVQIVSVRREDHTLGGAGNVVNNLAALGARVVAAGAVGDDAHGRRLLDIFASMGVDHDGVIQEPGRPTTRKTRVIAAGQQVLRIDRETLRPVSEQTRQAMFRFFGRVLPKMDVVLVSDYGKGLLSDALLSDLMGLCRRHGKISVVDPKGLDFRKYAGASLLTPNQKEAALAAGMEISDASGLHACAKKILDAVAVDRLLITRGRDGMTLFSRDKAPHHIAAKARQVFDVSGAGDTVLSVMGLAAAAGMSWEAGAALANTAAGIVVGKVGTAAVSRAELRAAGDDIPLKRTDMADLPALVRDLKKNGKKIVLTNGCFDLLHAGHIRLFAASKALGDVLIVAIDDDASVARVKGPGRPVLKAAERVRILCALDAVDHVAVFSSEDLPTLLEQVRPDVLTKGSNYTSEEVEGREIVEAHGGRVALIPVTEDVSATRIINDIRSGQNADGLPG